MKSDRLSGQFPCVERTSVWQRTVWLTLDVTTSLPVRVVAKAVDVSWVLHPLDHLKQTHKIRHDDMYRRYYLLVAIGRY